MNTPSSNQQPDDPAAVHERALAVFEAALQLEGEKRRSFLENACSDDDLLQAEVESLLEHDGALNIAAPSNEARVQQALLGALGKQRADDADEEGSRAWSGCRVGDRLGAYTLLQVIGEGGFGMVFAAQQEHPIRRRVALKVLKAGMDTKEVIARFEAERDALSLMDHSSIARVHDAGVTPAGRPFFVMEYVEGLDVVEFCNQEELTIAARLRLFIDVCAAVQHAHQKGVIHRDLKPSNILVTLVEGRHVPKVIDFGIAKATGPALGENSVFTLQGQFLGTPEYMSPEQAEMSAVGVDSTTDIYALGVVLYELLTGSLPFDPETLRSRGLAEVHRVLREVEPQKPSTRISTLGDSSSAISTQRQSDPRRLKSDLSGDLDWIVMRAMEKQRTRRYPSASELASDIRRHLAYEPVLAGPPSASYRVRKFGRRNRIGVSFAAVVALLLVSGIVGTTRGILEAEKNLKQATFESKRARAVTDFLLDTLGLADPDVTELPEMTMAAALDVAATAVDDAFADYPRNEAELRLVLGRAYFTLGRPDLAHPQLRRALMLHKEVLHSDDQDVVNTLRVFWQVANRLGDPSWQSMSQEAHTLTLRIIGRTEPDLATRLAAVDAKAISQSTPEKILRGEWKQVRDLAHERVRSGDPVASELANALFYAPLIMGWGSLTTDAAEMIEEEMAQPLAPLSNARKRLLWEQVLHFRMRAGDFAGASQRAERRIALLSNRLSPGHWYLEIYRFIIGACHLGAGRPQEARPILEECLRVFESSTAPLLWEASVVRQSLASLYETTGQPELASPHRAALLDEALGLADGLEWNIVSGWLSPDYAEVKVAVGAFDALVMGCRMTGAPLGTRAVEFADLSERLLDARRRCCPDEDPVAVLLAWQLAQRASALLLDDSLTAIGLSILEEAHRIGAFHTHEKRGKLQPWGRLLTAGMLYDRLVTHGAREQADRVGRDIDALVARDLPAREEWKSFAGLRGDKMIWRLVKNPGLDSKTYDSCASFALDVLDRAPDRSEFLGTIGAALYRAGRCDDALLWLTEAQRAFEVSGRASSHADLAFLAMAHYRLGRNSQAVNFMKRFDVALAGAIPPVFSTMRSLQAEAQTVLASVR